MDTDGTLDVNDRALDVLDVVHAGLHPFCGYEGKTVEENTEAVLGAIRSGKVDILVHPGNPWFPLDYQTIVEAAASNGVLLEINNASFTRDTGPKNVKFSNAEGCCKLIFNDLNTVA